MRTKNRYTGTDIYNWKVVNWEGKTQSITLTNSKGEQETKTLKGFNGYNTANHYAQQLEGCVAIRE